MALNDPYEMKPFIETLADDEYILGLFCVSGEDAWNHGRDLGESLISAVFDEMTSLFPSTLSTQEEWDYNFSLLGRYKISQTFLKEVLEAIKQRMPE